MIAPERILVIDDDPDVLSILGQFLTGTGFEVAGSKDGFEGLEKVEAEPNGFDLIITDIRMPFISGIGLIQILKEKFAHIPVVAITGAGEVARESSLAAKADAVLFKPFQLETIAGVIRDLLDKKRGSPASPAAGDSAGKERL